MNFLFFNIQTRPFKPLPTALIRQKEQWVNNSRSKINVIPTKNGPTWIPLGLIYRINQENITAAFVMAGVCLGPSSLSDSLIWLPNVFKTSVSFPTHNGRLPVRKRTALIFKLHQWISSLLIVDINNSSNKSVQPFSGKLIANNASGNLWNCSDLGMTRG